MNRTFEEMLIEQCAPTLAGVKPANLFRCRVQPDLYRTIYEWNRRLGDRGIRIRVVKQCRKADECLIYICRCDWMANILAGKETKLFLERCGYRPSVQLDDMLRQLSERLCLEGDFPHEIGIFLGYPLRDVIGFIENKGKNYSCCGHWKCYGDAGEAQQTFDRYKRCTAAYRRMYRRGVPLLRLVAAAPYVRCG